MTYYYLVIAYDTPSNKRRAKLAKTLKTYGERKQWSVFEVQITRQQYLILKRDIEAIIDRSEDVIAIYFLSPESLKKTIRIGNTQLEPPDAPSFV